MTNDGSTLRGQRYRLIIQLERLLDGPATYLAFVFAAALAVELIVTAQGEQPAPLLGWLQDAIWIFFILHFVLAMLIAPDRLLYVRRHWLTVLSLAVPFLRVIRVFRVVTALRAIRLIRVFSGINRTANSLLTALSWNQLGLAIGLSLTVIFLGSAGVYAFEAEDPVSPIRSYAEAVWWAAATLSTGGAASEPVTLGGRVIALFVMIAGLVLFGYVAGLLGALLFERRRQRQRADGRVATEDVRRVDQSARKRLTPPGT